VNRKLLKDLSGLMMQVPGLSFGPESGEHKADCNPQ
jgi:hypothetical protein